MDIALSSFASFCQQFRTEKACAEALLQARWPTGFVCPLCGHSHSYLITTRRLPLYQCMSCSHQTSLTAGTVMERSSTSLIRWFQALYLLSQPSGISASRLSKIIKVTYKTAWLIAHKIRFAMQQNDEGSLLHGSVRIEHFHYGDAVYDDARQPLLIGASFVSKNEPDQIRIKQPEPHHVDNASRQIKQQGVDAFIRDHTDRAMTPVFARYGKLHSALNEIKREVRRWLNLTFNGIGAKHLQAYLDAFCFRWHAKHQNRPMFTRLLLLCTATHPLPYPVLTRDRPILSVPWLSWGSKGKWKGHHIKRWTA